MGNNNISIKKCRTIFLWVLNFGEVGEFPQHFQNHPLGQGFKKMVSNFTILEFLYEIENIRVDFFWSENFLKGFLM